MGATPLGLSCQGGPSTQVRPPFTPLGRMTSDHWTRQPPKRILEKGVRVCFPQPLLPASWNSALRDSGFSPCLRTSLAGLVELGPPGQGLSTPFGGDEFREAAFLNAVLPLLVRCWYVDVQQDRTA